MTKSIEKSADIDKKVDNQNAVVGFLHDHNTHQGIFRIMSVTALLYSISYMCPLFMFFPNVFCRTTKIIRKISAIILTFELNNVIINCYISIIMRKAFERIEYNVS